jgi:hypothetical protein
MMIAPSPFFILTRMNLNQRQQKQQQQQQQQQSHVISATILVLPEANGLLDSIL